MVKVEERKNGENKKLCSMGDNWADYLKTKSVIIGISAACLRGKRFLCFS
ncbi:MAG: hypothetical protein H0V31_09195 [Acidobacteria bacterium]|nr:hypothetical protein [Acidobacteriota bacterium]